MYCLCKSPKLKKISIGGDVIDVCSKSLGGCGEEYKLRSESCKQVSDEVYIGNGSTSTPLRDALRTSYGDSFSYPIASYTIPVDGIYEVWTGQTRVIEAHLPAGTVLNFKDLSVIRKA